VGTLDHFAGMIGTGNIAPGGITLSTGTVMALATMCGTPTPKSCGCAMHYGFLPDTYVMLPVAESGGVSLEWFRRSCMAADYDEMNKTLSKRGPNELLFLPYLVGTNAPEFDSKANGVFWGLRQEHDAIDMAGAVLEGVACVLRKNCDHIAANGVKLSSIIATGGGCVTREDSYRPLHQNGTVIWVNRPICKLSTEERPLSVSGNLEDMYTARSPLYSHFADLQIDNNAEPEKAVETILKALKGD
jgi:glycerol kinase